MDMNHNKTVDVENLSEVTRRYLQAKRKESIL